MARAHDLSLQAPPRFRRRWSSPRFWLDWLVVNDPDLSRLRTGARPAIAVALDTALMALFASVTHLPLASQLAGITVSMLSTAQANDAPKETQRLTIGLLWAPAGAGLALGTLLAPHAWLGQLGLVGVTFLVIYIRRWGPRGLAFGQLGFMGYFFALFFQAPLATLPALLFGVVAGVGVAYAARFWIVPDDDRQSLRWSLHLLPIVLGMLLSTLADGLMQARGWGPREEVALREARRRVNRVAIALDDHMTDAAVAAIAPGLTVAELRERIFELELAIDHVAGRARVLASAHPNAETPRLEALVERPLGAPTAWEGRVAATRALHTARRLLRAHKSTPGTDEPPPDLAASLVALVAAERALGQAGTPGRLTPAEPALPPLPAVPEVGLQLPTRQAIQASIAVGLSMLAGSALSPTRWTWAAIGAYVMFIRATTLGETLVRGWHRILGTAAGAGAGIMLASMIAGHEGLELSVVCVAVFIGFYMLKGFYAGLVFGITLVIAVLYSMLGRYSPGLMLLRLEETLIGCVIGGLVAMVILPAPTRAKVDTTLVRLLRELAGLLREAAAGDLERTPAVLALSRGVDRTLQELRDAAKPLSVGLFGGTLHAGYESVHLADRVVLCLRHLAGSLDETALDGVARERLAAGFVKIEAQAEAIAAAIEHPPAQPLAPAPALRVANAQPQARTAFYWLERLEDALGGLQEAVREGQA